MHVGVVSTDLSPLEPVHLTSRGITRLSRAPESGMTAARTPHGDCQGSARVVRCGAAAPGPGAGGRPTSPPGSVARRRHGQCRSESRHTRGDRAACECPAPPDGGPRPSKRTSRSPTKRAGTCAGATGAQPQAPGPQAPGPPLQSHLRAFPLHRMRRRCPLELRVVDGTPIMMAGASSSSL